MRTLTVLLTVAAVAAPTAPAAAVEPAVFGGLYRAQIVEVSQPDGHPVEVRMFAAGAQTIVDGGDELEDGGCIEIFKDDVLDVACGALQVTSEPGLSAMRVRGRIDSVAYDYLPETVEFANERGSVITVDLLVTGTGSPRLAHSERTGVGVCGLPPDTRGVFVLGELPLERAGVPSGTLTSQEIGSVDPAGLVSVLRDVTFGYAGACI